MIEQIALGFLTVIAGVGAYLSARKMASGQIYYYGKTLPVGDAPPSKIKKEVPILIFTLGDAPKIVLGDVTISKSDLARALEIVLRHKQNIKIKSENPDEKARALWEDHVEKRLRALEEGSAPKEMKFMEEPAAQNVESVH